ncbi:MAG: cytochrome P450 [Gammaproteobacteria bacterium]|nr:cytochrome P450 [Gammaproteobacteria bacterium]MYK46837.1 cytochrome P450 [Gammaproteobacteria bacterium]
MKQTSTASGRQHPPGPAGKKLKNMRRLATDYTGFFHWLHEHWGGIVYFNMPDGGHCAIFDPDLAEEVLVRQPELFQKDCPASAFEVIQCPALARTPYGDDHGRLTDLIVTAFTPERIAAFKRVAVSEASSFADELTAGSTVDFRAEVERFTWNALTTTILGAGRDLGPGPGLAMLKAAKLGFIVFALPGYKLIRKLPLPHDLKARKTIKPLDEAVYEAIRNARDPASEDSSLIAHLVQATEQGESNWSFSNDSEIRDEAYAIFVGAWDSAVHVLAYVPHFLSRNPHVQARLEEEVDRVAGDRPLSAEDLERLPYAEAVVNELLRLQPPAPLLVPRRAMSDAEVGGFLIPEGTLVEVVPHVMHRRVDYWEDGEEFKPERWLAGEACPRHAHSYLPYGAEPRACRGIPLAAAVTVSGLAGLARKWRLEPESDELPADGLEVGTLSGPILTKVVSRVE